MRNLKETNSSITTAVTSRAAGATAGGIRRPLCTYFSPDRGELSLELRWCWDYFPPDDSVDEKKSTPRIPFLLQPHGAYCDSGPLAAHALRVFQDRSSYFRAGRNLSTVVLIGTEHASSARNFLCLDGTHSAWSTPLGALPVDDELRRRLTDVGVPSEIGPFLTEHSIENQLPLLQMAAKEWGEETSLRILPLSVRGGVTREDLRIVINERGLLGKVARVLKEYDGSGCAVAVVGTTDCSHVGPSYGVVPPGWPGPGSESIPDYIRREDGRILRALASSDEQVLFDVGCRTSMCGLGAALVWMRLGKILRRMGMEFYGSTPISLLKYCVGTDIGPPRHDQTGFATFIMT